MPFARNEQRKCGREGTSSSGDSTIAWCCAEKQDLQAIYAPHHLSMYSQNSNFTPAPKAGPHLHTWYVPMHFSRGQLPPEVFESDHVWLSLQAGKALRTQDPECAVEQLHCRPMHECEALEQQLI